MKTTLPKSVALGETIAGVQLCPFGEFPNGKTVQLCDEKALTRIVANYNKSSNLSNLSNPSNPSNLSNPSNPSNLSNEILCDFEHKSEDSSLTSDTAAAAWISNLAVNKERGLVGDLKFTDLGAEAVTNRRLRFLSPVWTLDADGRPDRLKSVALTNKPNIPVACVLNREPTPAVNPVEEPKENNMDKLKELLGLAPEATEEEILAAVGQLKEECAKCAAEKEEAEAETFAEENKKCCNKEALKKAYLLNKDAAKAMVAGFVDPSTLPPSHPSTLPPQTLLNKETLSTPELKLNKAQEGLAACKTPAERCAYVQRHCKELSAAE